MQLVRTSSKGTQLFCRLCPAYWLGEQSLAKRQRLVGANHISIRHFSRNEQRFFLRQQGRDLSGLQQAGFLLDRALVDIGRSCL